MHIGHIIGRYTRLTDCEGALVGLCPFCSADGLIVHPELQGWHCDECDRSGDAFMFLMRIEGVTFEAAVRMLIERVGGNK